MLTAPERSLQETAQRRGIEPGYWDISGKWHETGPDLCAELLAAMGDAPEDGAAILDPAVVLSRGDEDFSVAIRWPAEVAGPTVVRVEFEHGGGRQIFHEDGAGDPGRLKLPRDLPLGYHRLTVEGGGVTSATKLIICPDRAYLPEAIEAGERLSGLAVSLYGVHDANTWGCGDFTALQRLIDWAVDQVHASYLALNPLHAIANRQPFNTSPYLPNSLFYRNFLYLDITAIEEMRDCEEARQLLESGETKAEIRRLNEAEFVEYEGVRDIKLRFLRLLFRHFYEHEFKPGTPRGRRFARWAADEGELLDTYATYCALDEAIHNANPGIWIWPDWPEPFRSPHSEAVREFAAAHVEEILFHKYVQWQVDQQAAAAQHHAIDRGMAIGLFHDLPLATDRCGCELWAHRELYVEGCRVGAPPDGFSPKGQDWSFPPPRREAHRAQGYRYFAETIRKSARHGGALRIDHVMRLFRLYWIPSGRDATEGAYVRDYAEDLLRIVALESVRQRVLIVGEDLGTVEPAMRVALDRHGILSYRLFYFERHADGSLKRPEEYPVQALVSSTTHDLPTLAGYWAGRDIEVRQQLGLLGDDGMVERLWAERRRDKHNILKCLKELGLLDSGYPQAAADGPEFSGEIHNAITGFLAQTPCMLMTLNQEDLTKETDQQNLPATTWEYPNWRRKMKFSLDELEQSALAHSFAEMFRNWLDTRRRGRSSGGQSI